jgi:Flp pilus assembly pilin Flp
MTTLTRLPARLRSDRGASAVEYALIVTLVGGLVLVVSLIGQRVVANFASIERCYDNTCPAGTSASPTAAPTVAAAPSSSASAPAPAPSSSSTNRGHNNGNNGGSNNTGSNNNGGGNNTGDDDDD